MKVLVTGASGFVGSHVARLLVDRGQEVKVLLRGSSSREWIKGLPVEVSEGSLADSESLLRAVHDVGRVIHVAGTVAASSRDAFFEHNAHGTRRLLEACASGAQRLERLVFLSSLAAGGPCLDGGVRRESDPDSPVSDYGESKQAGEAAVLEFRDQISSVIVRPPMVYGPRDKGVLSIGQVASLGLMLKLPTEPPTAAGPKRYSQIHAEDLARGVVEMALAPTIPASGGIYHLASEEIVTEEQIYGAFSKALGKRLVGFQVPAWTVRVMAVGSELAGKMTGNTPLLNRAKLPELLAPAWTCSVEKVRRDFGFSASIPFEEGIRQTVEWYRLQGWLR